MNELDVAVRAARVAGAILAEHARGPEQVRHKGEIDLVTEVDLACERAVRDVLAEHTPDIPVLGEEGEGTDASTRWVVDPLDGTTNFVHGFPVYGVSIALEVDGTSTVGVVLDPVRDRLYRARRGGGAWCEGSRLQVSDCRDLADALVGTGFPYDRREGDKAAFYLGFVEAVLRRARGLRRAGAASIDLSLLASGSLDAFWEFGLHRWDVAAGRLLIEEAGGRFTGHDGGPVDPDRPSPLASNGWVHEAMVEVLATAPGRP